MSPNSATLHSLLPSQTPPQTESDRNAYHFRKTVLVGPENRYHILGFKFKTLSPGVRQKIFRKICDSLEPVFPASPPIPIKSSKVGRRGEST